MNYLAILDAAWQEHLKPRRVDAPTVISLFAGCGGSSLGYSMAGFRELLAVEWDDNAVATFRLNFPGVPIHHGDITKLTGEALMRLAGIQAGELGVLDGSPPCQGFSTAGKRDLADTRNQLFREYVRLLRELQPKVFVMENVSGMVKGKMKLVFADIMRELKGSGYKVSARLMNAMYFKVPQSRARMIFVGVRDGEPSHPKAAAHPISLNGLQVFDGEVVPAKSAKRIISSSRYRRIAVEKPCPTIKKRDAGLQNDGLYWETPTGLVEVSPTERKRFASFPEAFLFHGDKRNIAARIGNSVPPLFMRAIAEHVHQNLLS